MRAHPKPVYRLETWLCIALALGWLALSPLPARADGCFVFKPGHGTDVDEPTQRALIVHDAGREDLLLLVRYEGPRQEFGWLIPVPGRPRVSKGSTEPFRELSRLTPFPSSSGLQITLGSQRDEREEVEVLEDKTIGEYRVATLSAHSSGGLERWLKAQRFSLPKHKSGIIDEYIGKGWYFVAVKIRPSSAVQKSLKYRSGIEQPASPWKNARASGELTPLLISFDTPECVFPLKVSSIGGKASEVLVYVLSEEPMLSAVMFQKGMEGLRLERAALTKEALERRGFTATTTAHESLDNGYFGSSTRLFRSATISANEAPASAKLMPRIKGKRWQLTKQVWTFDASEMEDLIFTPAGPALTQLLKLPEGGVAADALVSGGGEGARAVLSAMRSTNSLERANASSMLVRLRGPDVAKMIPELLKDESAQVRLNAVMGAAASGLPKLTELLEPLRGDPHPRIRWHVAQILRASTRSGQ